MAVLTLSPRAKQARADALAQLIGAGSIIRLYDGVMPASPLTPLAGNTLLATVAGDAAAFAPPSSSDRVSALTGAYGGSGMTPTAGRTFPLTFSGGGGAGAAGLAVLDAGGAIIGYELTNPGTGYTSAPTVSLAAGGGTPPPPPTAWLGVVLAANPTTGDSAAAASGRPVFARITTASGEPVIDLDVGAIGSDACCQIEPVTIAAGQPVTLSGILLFEG